MKKIIFLFLLLGGTLGAQAQSSTPASKAQINSLLSNMPAQDSRQFSQDMEAIGNLGEKGLEAMAAMLAPEGQGDNTPLEYALNGFASYVAQPGREDWRSMSVQAYGHALDQISDGMNKQFLIHQLQLTGKDDAVPFLQPYLQDTLLCAPAAQTLATIRTPAATQILIQALKNNSGNTRPALVEALGDSRTTQAVSLITPLAKSKDPDLRKTALYALARIGDPASARTVLQAAQKSGYHFGADNATSNCFLYLQQLISTGQQKPAEKMIRTLLKSTTKDNQKAVHQAALQMQSMLQQHQGSGADTTAINTLNAEEKKAGFKILFNGKNLDQWVGNKKGYLVENGAIAVHPVEGSGGNLYTKDEYANFIFRFQFQLTPDANNGIGIRAPLTGDAAYVGMEIQVLDNKADMYKDLHVYQYHGSVYGVIPAKQGYLKPVGQWNEEEIRAEGTKIKVTLNGHVILDGDIDQASASGTADHKAHPGLKNKTGHIGFLGHGSVVRFRSLRVLDLASPGK